MVLVHADAVIAELVGIFKLVEVVVIGLVSYHRVIELRVDIHPDRAVLLAEVIRQVGIRHEVEPVELHGYLSISWVLGWGGVKIQ